MWPASGGCLSRPQSTRDSNHKPGVQPTQSGARAWWALGDQVIHTQRPPSPTRRSRNHALALCVVGLAGDQVKPRCNPPDVVQGQPTPMPSQTGLTPRTHPNGRRFWYLEMASSKIVIGKIFPTVLLRGQIIWVLVFTSSISIVQDQKHRQISMQKSTRVFRLRPPTRTRNRRVKHAKSDLRPNEWWQSAVQ